MTHQFKIGTFVDLTEDLMLPFNNMLLKGTTLQIVALSPSNSYRVQTFDNRQFGVTEDIVVLSLLECW